MPTEVQGHITIRGRFGDIQAATDAKDTIVNVAPTGATHMEVFQGGEPFQPIWYSLDGTANSWIRLPVTPRMPQSCVTVALNGATSVYFRKSINPRLVGEPRLDLLSPTYTGFPDAKEALVADDRLVMITVSFLMYS